MSVETLIAMGAAIAALVSALFAARNYRLAKRALAISEQQLDSKSAGISLYLIEGLRQRLENAHLVVFAVTFINRAESPNAVVRLELEIQYAGNDGKINHLLFPLLEDQAVLVPQSFSNLPKFAVPANLTAKSAQSGWLIFRVPNNATSGPTHRYRILAVDGAGQVATVESYLLTTVSDATDS